MDQSDGQQVAGKFVVASFKKGQDRADPVRSPDHIPPHIEDDFLPHIEDTRQVKIFISAVRRSIAPPSSSPLITHILCLCFRTR